MHQIIIGLLTAATRLRNSRNGNPRWRLTISGTKYTTKADSYFVYKGIDHMLNSLVMVKLNEGKRIIDITPLHQETDVRLIDTLEELNELPPGTLVQAAAPAVIYVKDHDGYWVALSGSMYYSAEYLLEVHTAVEVKLQVSP